MTGGWRDILTLTLRWTQSRVITPSHRIYTVPAESRIYTVPAESRIYTVPAESRIYTVPVE